MSLDNDKDEIGVIDEDESGPHNARELDLQADLDKARAEVGRLTTRLKLVDKIKIAMKPFAQLLRALVVLCDPDPSAAASAALAGLPETKIEQKIELSPLAPTLPPAKLSTKVEQLLARAGTGVTGRMYRAILQHGQLSRAELATMAGSKQSSGSFTVGLAFLRSIGATIDGKMVTYKA